MDTTIAHNQLISVIMPVYNPGLFLSNAISCILEQTYDNIELIIIDDASSDGSDNLIKQFTDPRIRYIRNTANLGIVKTLNRGVRLARGTYIARMDADDMCHPARLEKQLRYLKNHTAIAMVGTLYAKINMSGAVEQIEPVLADPCLISLSLSLKNCFCHGSVMFNTLIADKKLIHYSNDYPHVEDYHLWSTLVDSGFTLGNVPEPLYFWRTHSNSISSSHKHEQNKSLSDLSKSLSAKRDNWSFSDIFSFISKKAEHLSETTVIGNMQYETYYKRELQFILATWASLEWPRKPFHAVVAMLLVLAISPRNIFKKLLHAN